MSCQLAAISSRLAAHSSIPSFNYFHPVNRTLAFILFSGWACLSFGRINLPDSLPKGLLSLGYGYQLSLFDLNARYGGHGALHGSFGFIRGTWELGLGTEFLFGANVKEDVLAPLRAPGGELIGEDHQLAEVDLRQRGLFLGMHLGRSFRLGRQSLVLSARAGWLAHWIRFQNPGNTFKPIQGEYRAGYDRFSSGFAIGEQLAYRYLGRNRLINFEIALQFSQAFIRLRRNIQLDDPAVKPSNRFDGLAGFQARWIIPIYSKKDPGTLYY